MMDAKQVKEKLLSNVESVCFYLFPKGKVRGHEFLIGSPAGEEGSSMTINLRGDKKGVWRDHATMTDKGDIFDLWCIAKGQTFKEAFPEICRYSGITNIERPKPKPRPPKPSTADVHPMSGTPELEYLTTVRGLHPNTLKKFRMRTHRRPSEHNEHFVCFQYTDSEGEPTMLKSTGIKPAMMLKADGTKKAMKDIWTTEPFYTLWGWWNVQPADRRILICEGEIDAMTVDQLDPGMPVLSVPNGCGNMDWIENDYDRLQQMEEIFLLFDRDQPDKRTGLCAGEEAAKNAAKRLGLARCKRLLPPEPFKDANEALTKGEPEQLEISGWFARAFSYDPPTLRGVGDVWNAMLDRIDREAADDAINTFLFPDFPFQLRNGECSLWQGFPGHGKSELLYQAHLHEMASGNRACIASMEIGSDEMLVNIVTQFIGHKPANRHDHGLEKAKEWLSGRLWFFSCAKEEDVKPAQIWEDFRYALQRFGCNRFVIDSLMFCVRKDDYEGQDQFAKQCRAFTRNNPDVHLSLIAHSAIKKGEDKVPAMSDVLGSAGILAPFNNVLTVWRNVEKEEKTNIARESNDTTKIDELAKLHDGLLLVCKQRRTGKRPRAKLWFDNASKSFRTKQADVVPPVADTAPTLPLKQDDDQPF